MKKYRIIKKGIERKYHAGQPLEGCAVEMLGELMYVSSISVDFEGRTYAMLLWVGAGGVLLSIIARIDEGVSVYPAAIVDEQGSEQDRVYITKFL